MNMAAPELRLNVSLDLGFFRQQLQKLTGIAQSEFTPKLNVKFNRSTLDAELNNLQRAIKRRTYRVEIGGNIDDLPNKIKTLKEQLSSLESFKVDLGVGAVKSLSKKDAAKIVTDLRGEILGERKKIYIPVSIKPSITRQDVRDFQNAVKSKLTGISVKVKADLESASISSGAKSRADIDADVRRGLEAISEIGAARMAGKTGGVTEAARREQLKQSLATGGFGIDELKNIGKQLGVTNVGRFKNINNLIEKIVADASVEMVKKYLDPQAVMRNPDRSMLGKVLDTFARGVFNILGMDPASIRAQQQASKQKAFTPAGLLPGYTSRGAREEIMRRLGEVDGGQGGKLALSNEALGRRVSAILQEYFKIAEVQVRESFDPRELKQSLNVFSYVAQSLRDAETRTKQARVAESVDSLMNAISQSIKTAEAAARIRLAQIRELPQRPPQGMLSGARIAGFLPPGAGRASNPYGTGRLGQDGESRAELFARREREARMRSALRGVDVMSEGGMAGRPPSSYSYAYRAARPQGAIVPYAPGGAMVYSGPGGGGLPPGGGTYGGPGNFAGRGGGPGGGFNMPKLPGAGLVREIGQEFAFATKQVLLFGTAYKALAFATNFPAQVGQAVAALQSFNNTLKAVSPNAKEVEASNKLILQLVDKYNIPLQSARDGFTKLYASMQSAGFGGNEVRDIFTGISKAAATFGMSADKVDRVNYAFAQMASKGQVMSEELKGQLGDVLPGALGIFAEAAGFKGPDAIQKFSAALEDGAYKGQAMKQLLTNVGIVMNKEFGPGAEGAARTFQGAMNRMQNSMKLLYESFEPVAVGFLNTVVMPMTSGIKTVTDGFNAFFTGQAAQTAGGSALAQQLNELKPSFEGILSNIKELVPTFQLLGNILIGVAKAFTVIIGNPIVGFLAKLYANVLLINGVFTLLGGKVLVSLIGSIGAAVSRFVALNVAVVTTQRTATVANSTLAGTQLQMALLQKSAGMATGPIILLRNALLSLANMGLIAIGINVVINGLAELDRLKRSLAEIGTFSSAKYRKEVSGMSKEDINSRLIENKRTQQAIEKELRRYTGPLGAAEGLTTGRDEELRARLLMVQTKEQELIRANKTAKAGVSLDSQVTGGITPVGTGTGGSQKTKGKGKDRESQVAQLALELEYAKELSALEAQIFNAQLGENNLLAVRLEGEKELLDLRYEKLKVDLEDIPPEEKKLKIQTISQKADLARIKTRSAMEAEITKAINEQQRAVESLQAASQLDLDNKKRYQELLKNGVAPEQAKILIEVDNEIKKIREALELTRKRVKAEIDILEALKAQGKTIDEALLNRLKGQYGEAGQGIEALPGIATEETAKRFALNMPKTPTEYVAEGLDQARKNLAELANAGSQGVNAANAIGDAFGNAFKGIIDGSMTAREALAGMFQSIADHFADMVAQMIAEWIKMMVLKGIEAIINPMAGLASLGGGGGGGLSSGFSAGTASAIPTDAAGWGAAFSTPLKFATGGIAPGGFTAFANGGMVTGPTMGLVGEGRYNEAIVPLPNGKSIPVELGGASQGNVNVVVNVDAKGSQVEGNEAQSKQLGRVVSAAVQAEIVKQQRPGGLLSSSRSF